MENLIQRYPEVKIATIEEESGKKVIHVKNLWGDDTLMLRFKEKENLSFLDTLSFPNDLVAHYSISKKYIEVYFTPVPDDFDIVKREFDFTYKGHPFHCSFKQPTKEFELIARGFAELKPESKSGYRNLRPFRDFYRKDESDKYIPSYIKESTAYNFFIEGPIDKIQDELTYFMKTLNFYMNFYDRDTPSVLIFSSPHEKEPFKLPCYTLFDEFPKQINGAALDKTLLDILSVANYTNDIRLQFIFYFQILEYCSYYYLKSDLQTKLSSLLKKPDIGFKSQEYSKRIIEEFKNHFKANDDKTKLDILIKDLVDISDLKLELDNNLEYFSRELIFDGGLM